MVTLVRHSSTTYGHGAALSQAPQVLGEAQTAHMIDKRSGSVQSVPCPMFYHLNGGLPPSEGFPAPISQAERGHLMAY